MDNKIVDNDTVNTIVEKLKHTRFLAIIGLIAMILGTLLPYIKYEAFVVIIKKSLFLYWDGKIAFVLLIANLIFFFKDYIERYVPSLLNVPEWNKVSELIHQYAIAPIIIVVLLVLYRTIKIDISFGHYNIGFYTLWFGVICMVIYFIINKGKAVIPEKNAKSSNEIYGDFQNINKQTNNTNPNYSNRANNNITPNYNNGANNINPNYNNRANNINPNYNNGANNNINLNYNNRANNINPNYNNGANNNINPNYNGGISYGINQNNNTNYNTDQSYYNGQNQNTNYNPNNNYNNIDPNNTVNPNINNYNSNNNQNNNM